MNPSHWMTALGVLVAIYGGYLLAIATGVPGHVCTAVDLHQIRLYAGIMGAGLLLAMPTTVIGLVKALWPLTPWGKGGASNG